MGGCRMGMEQLEFIIHPDGRVEEKVIGIKGGQVPASSPYNPADVPHSHRARSSSGFLLAPLFRPARGASGCPRMHASAWTRV